MPSYDLEHKAGRKMGAGKLDKDHILVDFQGVIIGIGRVVRSLPMIGTKNAYQDWHLFLTYGA